MAGWGGVLGHQPQQRAGVSLGHRNVMPKIKAAAGSCRFYTHAVLCVVVSSRVGGGPQADSLGPGRGRRGWGRGMWRALALSRYFSPFKQDLKEIG